MRRNRKKLYDDYWCTVCTNKIRNFFIGCNGLCPTKSKKKFQHLTRALKVSFYENYDGSTTEINWYFIWIELNYLVGYMFKWITFLLNDFQLLI